MKKYGIYLAYPPTVDMRSEGLGRHLAEFLKAAQERGDVRFVIACPSWTRASLLQLCDAFAIRPDTFEVIGPSRQPWLLTAFVRYVALRKRAGQENRRRRTAAWLRAHLESIAETTVQQLVTVRGWTAPIRVGVVGVGGLLLLIPLGAVALVATVVAFVLRTFRRQLRKRARLQFWANRIAKVLGGPKDSMSVVRAYRLMEGHEASLVTQAINGRDDIAAWYAPAAFWPSFNAIQRPRLTCVPDVVLGNFPIGFSQLGGDRALDAFRDVETTINGGHHYVTYSEDVKWETLVKRHHVDPGFVNVVRHGANAMDDLVVVSGFPDNTAATNALCKNLFRSALYKSIGNDYAPSIGAGDVRFIFYASQFRPNKNVISLLRAYENLLRRRYIGHKLVLTGNPQLMPDIQAFIADHRLTNDVLCLHGLTAQELAACYRLADVAVNPSLSEGGCPFTFTEALSLGTPVVMARIPVTEEVITDKELQNIMLFDPYDWKDIARRIEWAIRNRDSLYTAQKPFYDMLATRTWRHVVNEYVNILDRISSNERTAT